MSPDELKRARKKLGLSTEDLARILCISSNRTIRKWEAGIRGNEIVTIPKYVGLIIHLIERFPQISDYLKNLTLQE